MQQCNKQQNHFHSKTWSGIIIITLKSFGRTPAGWPRITNNLEFNFLKFWSRSSRDCRRNLHLLIPTLLDPANQGSRINMHLKVVESFRPCFRDGLSCSLRPFLNQCTACFSLEFTFLALIVILQRKNRDCFSIVFSK